MKPRITVLYERDRAGRPHGSSYLRLIQPLRQGTASRRFHVTFAPVFSGEAELVVVDRLWHPSVDVAEISVLLDAIAGAGARFVYALDDDLLDPSAPFASDDYATRAAVVRLLLERADAVIVTTRQLAARLAPETGTIHTVINALDGALLSPIPGAWRPRTRVGDELVLGYMGTRTHDEDLLSLLPVLGRIGASVQASLVLELIGGVARSDTYDALARLPFPLRVVEPPVVEYPWFLLWFSSFAAWDIGLAPLRDTDFNRSKSDLKFLDYSSAGVPTICSRVEAYAGTVEHGRTGWLVDNDIESWQDGLEQLLARSDLRDRLSRRAYTYLVAERLLARRSADLVATLESILTA